MTGRKQKATRVMPPDALALPHVVEAIAMCLSNQEDFMSFLDAVPRSGRTPALTAFLDCTTTTPPSVRANWPRIELRDMALPPLVLTLLAATLPLRPRIHRHCSIWNAAPLASLVAAVGPALSSVTLFFYSSRMNRGRGQAISSLLLQRCPRLRHVSIDVLSYSENEAVELNDLLAVVAHPHLSVLSFFLHSVPTVLRLGHRLSAWLSTAPATKLRLAYVAQMDHDGAIAFCDALQASTTLQELIIADAPSLGGFHGRTLPVSLKKLHWNAYYSGDVDDATLTNLATAVGRTQLEELHCSVFGPLATCPAAAPMLSKLQSLVVRGLHEDAMEKLIAGVSLVPALTTLELRGRSLSTFMEPLLEALMTTCVHLETLSVDDDLTRDGSAALLSGVLRLPRLTTLDLSMHLLDVLHVLPELVATGRQLRHLALSTIECDNNYNEEKRAIYKALAQVHDVPFVLQRLPKDMDKFVVDALSPRADHCHQCDLDF